MWHTFRRTAIYVKTFLAISFMYAITSRCPPQELHQAVKSKDILAVLQAFAEGVELSTPLPGHVSI